MWGGVKRLNQFLLGWALGLHRKVLGLEWFNNFWNSLQPNCDSQFSPGGPAYALRPRAPRAAGAPLRLTAGVSGVPPGIRRSTPPILVPRRCVSSYCLWDVLGKIRPLGPSNRCRFLLVCCTQACTPPLIRPPLCQHPDTSQYPCTRTPTTTPSTSC